MVTTQHGPTVWDRVRAAAGVQDEVFLSNKGYPDATTYKLVGAVCEVTGIEGNLFLEEFGVFWIMKTARESYGDMMAAGGHDLGEFLVNLPNFHTRVHLVFPQLVPPVFRCSEVSGHSLRLHYHSEREGLSSFVVGLVKGLGQMFRTPVEVTHEVVRGAASDHDVFLIHWGEALTA